MPGLRAASLTAGIGSAARNWGSVAYRCATRLANRSGLSAWPDPAVLPSLEPILIVLPSIDVLFRCPPVPEEGVSRGSALATIDGKELAGDEWRGFQIEHSPSDVSDCAQPSLWVHGGERGVVVLGRHRSVADTG